MRDPLILVIFAITVGMSGILIAIGFAEPVINASGIPHPSIPAMRAGGDGAARLAEIGSLAFMFQCLLLALIVCLAALGVSKQHRNTRFYALLGLGFTFMLFVWWQTYSAHQEFLETGITEYFLGFPVATAWQVYGTWLGGIPLILLYTLGFRKFIYTEEDQKKFEKLLKDHNKT